MRVAVVGTGIAGNAAAWALSRQYQVTIYERELRPGGHSHTVTIDYDGDPFELSFNARYLLDVTDQISGEQCELRFGGPNDPALVLDPLDADVRYVLMPLRV